MLKWEGVQQSAEVDSVRRCIRQNAAQLTDLSIGFFRCSDASDLCEEILGSNRGYAIQALFLRSHP